MEKQDFSCLLPRSWETIIDQWLDEDIPSFDYGGFVVGNEIKKAILWAKSSCTLSGVLFFTRIFETLGCHVDFNFEEGTEIEIEKGQRVQAATVKGPANKILLGERVALNLISRASGIATRARSVKRLAEKANWSGIIAGTRKTTPGFRFVEKYSLLVGGVDQHRYDLSSMIMLKDNHIVSKGSISNAIKAAKLVGGFALKIEVECSDLSQAEEAIQNGADIVMLDNFEPSDLAHTSQILKKTYGNRVLLEASGGITVDNVSKYMVEGVDIISMGCLTQGVPHIDFSLKIVNNIVDDHN